MKSRLPSLVLPARVAFLLLVLEAVLQAGGPLLIKDGVPRRWATSAPIVLDVDPGPLGGIPSDVANSIVQFAIGQWNGVTTSQLRLAIGAPLSKDIESLTKLQFDNFTTKDDGTNPVLFDSTGAMFDALFGTNSMVVGVAGPSLIVTSTGTIVKGFAMFNGASATTAKVGAFKAVITHELGHMLNLQHSQVNGVHLGESIPGFSGIVTADSVETMYPILVPSNADPHPMATLEKDDIAAISALYPANSFAPTTAAITGMVFDIDGVTPIQGINVVARNVDRPFVDVFSYVSGLLVDPPSPSIPRSLLGAYELRGVTPGLNYKIYIEEVASFFVQGARVGPLDPPLDIDSTDPVAFLEFWSGANESADDPPDDPLQGEILRPSSGTTTPHVDFIFNGVKPRLENVDPPSGLYSSPQTITLTGANFLSALSVQLKDPAMTELNGLQVISPRVLTAVVPAGAVPGKYSLVVTTTKGSSDPSPVTYEVTEPPPTVISTMPDSIPNDQAGQVMVNGSDLLGAKSAQMVKAGGVEFDLRVVQVISAAKILVEVPAGVLPGNYNIRVTNTAGTSPPSTLPLRVVELAPVLSSDTKPRAAANSASKQVRILGQNLAGTTAVELVGNGRQFFATLNGAQEAPPVTTLATGSANFTFNSQTGKLLYHVKYFDLSSSETAAHIHKGAMGVGGGVVVPLPPGNPKDGSLKLTPEQAADLLSGLLFVDVHSQQHALGEIRGQILPLVSASVPLIIVSTSLNEVVVSVPGGLEPGVYVVRLTNSKGVVTGPATFTVKKSSGGGGGGGCGGTILGGGPHHTDLPILLALLLIGSWLRGFLRPRLDPQRRLCRA